MQQWLAKVKTFLVAEDGPTAVEYAVMLAMIIVVCLAAVSAQAAASPPQPPPRMATLVRSSDRAEFRSPITTQASSSNWRLARASQTGAPARIAVRAASSRWRSAALRSPEIHFGWRR